MILVVTIVMSEKGTPVKRWKRFLQVCKLRALAAPLYGKITFLCFTYGTGKVEIENMVCVKDVYTAAKGDWVPVCYDE